MGILLVFFAVEGASGIDEYAAWFECFPYIIEDIALALSTLLYVAHAPFGYRPLILAEHTFARTGGINEDTIEELGQFVAKISRRVMGHHSVAVTPFLDVLREDKHALTHNLVANEQALIAKELADKGGLATWCSAEVKDDTFWLEVLVKHLTNEHTTGLLHIVATCVQKRIKGKLRTTTEVVSIFVPRYLFGVGVEGEIV